MRKLLIINGPNLNLLGRRQPEVYGSATMEDCIDDLRRQFPGMQIDYYQSNIEGELIDRIQASEGEYDGAAINAGGYTHTSVAIADAISSVQTPFVEVHISNILAREEYRHVSLIAPRCRGSIMGFGMDSYRLAILALLK